MDSDASMVAAKYFRQAYELQSNGDYAQALVLYTRSIDAFPTAEAYTFRGWTYSFTGDYDSAIADCHSGSRSILISAILTTISAPT